MPAPYAPILLLTTFSITRWIEGRLGCPSYPGHQGDQPLYGEAEPGEQSSYAQGDGDLEDGRDGVGDTEPLGRPLLRILQFAVDEGAIEANPVRKVPAPRRRVDPDQVLNATKRRALTPEEPGRLLAQFPLFWWDHVLCLLGTGLRFGELAGLRRRRVQLNRPLPLLQVVDTRDQAGRFGSGFK
jgi:hypothetical protein